MKHLSFQKEFIRAVENPKLDTIILSGPRGLGKTYLAGFVLARCLTPGDSLNVPGSEYILGSASIEMARLTYGFIRETLEPTGEYSFIDSATRLGITHRPSNTKLRVISSSGKTAMGIVRCPIAVLDEPGALDLKNGELLSTALLTAQGKPGSKLKVLMIGTLSPGGVRAGHWWFDLVHGGSKGRTHVQLFQGDLETWDSWQTIRRANPLANVDAGFREKLLEERNAARLNTRLKAQFLSYRENLPTADEAEMVLSVLDWRRVLRREVKERQGRPLVGVDLGQNRAWSTAVSLWPSGRMECIALTAGLPDIAEQEKRDGQPRGIYQALVDSHKLRVAHGLRVPPVKQLTDFIQDEWGKPRLIICDRFKLDTLKDNARGIHIEPRITRWSESTEDIQAFRQMALDGPLSIPKSDAGLMTASLAQAMIENDDSGNSRMIKRGSNNKARDDTAVAAVLVAGEWVRRNRKPKGDGEGRYKGLA